MTYEGLLLIVLFDSTSTIASIFPTNFDLIKMKELRSMTWIITDCRQTVHYYAITWCYLCSVNQYASFGTPQAYSGGNKKSAVFSRKTQITRDKCGKKCQNYVF